MTAPAVTPLETRGSATPSFLGRWNFLLPALAGLLALSSGVSGFLVQSAGRSTVESTGPTLIGVQDVFGSVAEANAAATGAHLAVKVNAEEDRSSRNLYVDALGRANSQLNQIATDLGASESFTGLSIETGTAANDQISLESAQRSLQEIGSSLNVYSGEIEAARLANSNNLDQADERLSRALSVVDEDIAPAVVELTTFGQNRFDLEAERGRLLTLIALAVGLITLGGYIWMQYKLAQRTRRLINPLLALATLAIVAIVGLLGYGLAVRSVALNDARSGGYDAITATAEMQSSTFGLQSILGLALLADGAEQSQRLEEAEALIAQADRQVAVIANGADSEREQAAAAALGVRWQRYQRSAQEILETTAKGDREAAVARLQGEGLSTFSGVNTAIESVRSDNRDQFNDGVARAQSAINLNPWLYLILSVAAALLAVIGVQQRLGDYR